MSENVHWSTTESLLSISAEESVLLMHYLDIVFPLQYPMYRPELVDERGWLLSLLLRTKSFYHGALALSVHHRHTRISTNSSQSRRLTAIVQQEQHLEICINAVNQFAQNSCPKNGVGVATAVLQLFFYEVFCVSIS